MPNEGDLIVHQNGWVGNILSVEKTAYGYWMLEVFGSGEIKLLSTLNCEPIDEHYQSADYDINNLSKGEYDDNDDSNRKDQEP